MPVKMLHTTKLSPYEWVIEAGQTAVGYLTIANHGHSQATFTIQVAGLDENWVMVSPASINLEAGQQTIAMISISPPRLPASRAGTYPLLITTSSSNGLDQQSRQAATLVINPYYEFAVSELWPKQQAISHFKRAGQLLIPVTNKSNCEASFRLTGVDEAEVCHFEFESPHEAIRLAKQVELRLAPDQTLSVPIHLTPPPGRLISLSPDTYYFTITTSLLEGRQMLRSVSGQLMSRPLIGPWLITPVILCLLALIVILIQISINTLQTNNRLIYVRSRPQLENRQNQSWFPQAAVDTTTNDETDIAPEPMTYAEMFQEIAPKYGLDWRILAEQAYRESRLDPYAFGADQDMGLMQIIPSTWAEWAPKVGVSDPYDPYSNVLVGAAYLAYVREYCHRWGHPEPRCMLVGYNWGPDNLRQLFETNGDWEQIPVRQRSYALDILLAAELRPPTLPQPNFVQGSRLDELLATPVR